MKCLTTAGWAVEVQAPLAQWSGKRALLPNCKIENPSSYLVSRIPHHGGEHWGTSLQTVEGGTLGSLDCGGGATVFSTVFVWGRMVIV